MIDLTTLTPRERKLWAIIDRFKYQSDFDKWLIKNPDFEFSEFNKLLSGKVMPLIPYIIDDANKKQVAEFIANMPTIFGNEVMCRLYNYEQGKNIGLVWRWAKENLPDEKIKRVGDCVAFLRFCT